MKRLYAILKVCLVSHTGQSLLSTHCACYGGWLTQWVITSLHSVAVLKPGMSRTKIPLHSAHLIESQLQHSSLSAGSLPFAPILNDKISDRVSQYLWRWNWAHMIHIHLQLLSSPPPNSLLLNHNDWKWYLWNEPWKIQWMMFRCVSSAPTLPRHVSGRLNPLPVLVAEMLLQSFSAGKYLMQWILQLLLAGLSADFTQNLTHTNLSVHLLSFCIFETLMQLKKKPPKLRRSRVTPQI